MTPLGLFLRELIAAEGPITVARYMALALGHPVHGYYPTRDPLGRAGDFTTAPEISQMFGELLGLWAAAIWLEMGRPASVALVELGPGRGTLMADALRATRTVPGFRDAVRVHLVETSPALRGRQRDALAPSGAELAGHEGLGSVPPGPAIVLANEFLDALPVRQFVRQEGAWRERLVGLGPEGALAFGLAPEAAPGFAAVPGREGDVLEIAETGLELVRSLSGRLAAEGGAALFVDYGHLRSGLGDTLQALSRHAYADPLANPGEQDLTTHVDFAAVARAARAGGAAVHGPVGQGAFLRALGIVERAERLAARASPEAASAVALALARLIGEGTGQMGALFKAVGLAEPGLSALPGLPPAHVTAPEASC